MCDGCACALGLQIQSRRFCPPCPALLHGSFRHRQNARTDRRSIACSKWKASIFQKISGFPVCIDQKPLVRNADHVPFNSFLPAVPDNWFQKMFDNGWSNSCVRCAQGMMSVALEHARKHPYAKRNAACDSIAKFGKQAGYPSGMPRAISKRSGKGPLCLQACLACVGKRRFGKRHVGIVEQLQFHLPREAKRLWEWRIFVFAICGITVRA